MQERIGSDTERVIWDLDGTLLDSLGVFEEALAEVAPQYGLEVPTREIMAVHYHGSLEESISGVLGGIQGEQLSDIVRDFLVMQNTQYAVIEGHLFNDAENLARRLHEAGKYQSIVTNRDHEGRLNASPRNIVANSDLHKYIDETICGDDSEHRKPKPEVLGQGLAGHVAEKTIVIGDQFVDVQFAYCLGSRAILICRDGKMPPNMDGLDHDWQSHVTIVESLDDVEVA